MWNLHDTHYFPLLPLYFPVLLGNRVISLCQSFISNYFMLWYISLSEMSFTFRLMVQNSTALRSISIHSIVQTSVKWFPVSLRHKCSLMGKLAHFLMNFQFLVSSNSSSLHHEQIMHHMNDVSALGSYLTIKTTNFPLQNLFRLLGMKTMESKILQYSYVQHNHW